MLPQDEEEALIIRGFTLSLKSGMNSVELDTLIVLEVAKKYEFDFIELVQILKRMLGVFNESTK